MKNDDEKPGSKPEVLQIDDKENIRLREQLVTVKKELDDVQTRWQTQVTTMQNELTRMADRETAHTIALRALGLHTENVAMNVQRFDAIAKDFEIFHKDVVAINERLGRIEKRLEDK